MPPAVYPRLGVSASGTRVSAAARAPEGRSVCELCARGAGGGGAAGPGLRAGPVVSRPGRWELRSGINCLFVSGWEVSLPPPPSPATSCSRSGSALGAAALLGGGRSRVPVPGQPETRVRLAGRGCPPSRDAGDPCRPPRPAAGAWRRCSRARRLSPGPRGWGPGGGRRPRLPARTETHAHVRGAPASPAPLRAAFCIAFYPPPFYLESAPHPRTHCPQRRGGSSPPGV